MNNFTLHVGLPKTGTTTLQDSLFARHSQICYFGKRRGSPYAKAATSEAVNQLLKPAIWKLGSHFDPKAAQTAAQSLDLPNLIGSRVQLASWEALGINNPTKFGEMLRRLSRTFGSCRIMITLRNPLTLLPSSYLQDLRGHSMKRDKPHMGGRVFMEFDEWLNATGNRHPGWHVNYGHNIRTAVSLLGKGNVGVFVFEDLLKDPKRYYTGICEFLGIDADEGLALTTGEHMNTRITISQLTQLKRMESSLVQKLLWRLSSKKQRQRLFRRANDNTAAAKVILSDDQRNKISNDTALMNRWLDEEFGLNLGSHGYPL